MSACGFTVSEKNLIRSIVTETADRFINRRPLDPGLNIFSDLRPGLDPIFKGFSASIYVVFLRVKQHIFVNLTFQMLRKVLVQW